MAAHTHRSALRTLRLPRLPACSSTATPSLCWNFARDAPELDESATEALQSAHLAHLAELHDRGVLMAAGPLLGDAGRVLRGLSIWNAPPSEVQRIIDEHPDPAVVAGRFCVRVIPWMTPAHAIVAAQSRFPRSVAEAQPD